MWWKIAVRITQKPEYVYHVTNQNYKVPYFGTEKPNPPKSEGFGGDAFGVGYYTTKNPSVLKGYYKEPNEQTIRRQKIPAGARILNLHTVPQDKYKEILYHNYKTTIGRDPEVSEDFLQELSEMQLQKSNKNISVDLRHIVPYIKAEKLNEFKNKYKDQVDKLFSIDTSKYVLDGSNLEDLLKQLSNEGFLNGNVIEIWNKFKNTYDLDENSHVHGIHKKDRSELLHSIGYDAIEYHPFTNYGTNDSKAHLSGNNMLIINPKMMADSKLFEIEKRTGKIPEPLQERAIKRDKKLSLIEEQQLWLDNEIDFQSLSPENQQYLNQNAEKILLNMDSPIVRNKFSNGDLPPIVLQDFRLLIKLLEYHWISPEQFKNIPEDILRNKEFIQNLANSKVWYAFIQLPQDIKEDKEVVKVFFNGVYPNSQKAITLSEQLVNSGAFEKIRQQDPDFINEISDYAPSIFYKFLPEDQKNDINLIAKLFTEDNEYKIYPYLPEKFKEDPAYAIPYLIYDPIRFDFRYIPQELREPGFVLLALEALSNHKSRDTFNTAYKRLPEELKSDSYVAKSYLENNGNPLYLPSSVLKDPEIYSKKAIDSIFGSYMGGRETIYKTMPKEIQDDPYTIVAYLNGGGEPNLVMDKLKILLEDPKNDWMKPEIAFSNQIFEFVIANPEVFEKDVIYNSKFSLKFRAAYIIHKYLKRSNNPYQYMLHLFEINPMLFKEVLNTYVIQGRDTSGYIDLLPESEQIKLSDEQESKLIDMLTGVPQKIKEIVQIKKPEEIPLMIRTKPSYADNKIKYLVKLANDIDSTDPVLSDYIDSKITKSNEPKRFHEIDQSKAYEQFKDSYEKSTGAAWSEEKFKSRAQNWHFYGDDNGFVTVRPQKDDIYKLTGVAGSPRSIIKGVKDLHQSDKPSWGMVTANIRDMATKIGFITFPPLVLKLIMNMVPQSVFGNTDFEINKDKGSVTFNYTDVPAAEKYFIANKAYISWLINKITTDKDVKSKITSENPKALKILLPLLKSLK